VRARDVTKTRIENGRWRMEGENGEWGSEDSPRSTWWKRGGILGKRTDALLFLNICGFLPKAAAPLRERRKFADQMSTASKLWLFLRISLKIVPNALA